MTKTQTITNQLKDFMIETEKKQKPETAKQLISLIQQTQNLTEKEIAELLIELENENKLQLTQKKNLLDTTPKAYVSSKEVAWFWITIALAAATVTAVFTIPEDTPPVTYLRSALGILFVLFLPGFAFVKALFPQKVSKATDSEDMDDVERIALGVGVSLALTPLVGLILNYTPWGITLTPLTLSLLALTVLFATAAVLREQQTKTEKANPS
jgi:hypothetical protein